MAALIARRLGGSVIQRMQPAAFTSPAVVPRRLMHTDQPAAGAMLEIQHMKEELYKALSKAKAEKSFMANWQDRRMLRNLSGHVIPRPCDIHWRWLRVSKVANNVVDTAAAFTCVLMLYMGIGACQKYVAGEEILAPSKKRQEQ